MASAYVFKPYDVLQVWQEDGSSSFLDFMTIRTAEDARSAMRCVELGKYEGRELVFRIARMVPCEGMVAVYTWEQSQAEFRALCLAAELADETEAYAMDQLFMAETLAYAFDAERTAMQAPKYMLAERLAGLVAGVANCERSGNAEWASNHAREIIAVVAEYMPHGSGFDGDMLLQVGVSTPVRLVFRTEFHHMDDLGYYEGWTAHKVIVTPTFGGIDVQVEGDNFEDIHDHIGDTFYHALTALVPMQSAIRGAPSAVSVVNGAR